MSVYHLQWLQSISKALKRQHTLRKSDDNLLISKMRLIVYFIFFYLLELPVQLQSESAQKNRPVLHWNLPSDPTIRDNLLEFVVYSKKDKPDSKWGEKTILPISTKSYEVENDGDKWKICAKYKVLSDILETELECSKYF